MLGYIEGKIVSKNEETLSCVLLSYRIGFEITVLKRAFDAIEIGSKIGFWIHTHVREDILALYGFQTEIEKQFFRLLLSVSGLGPKSAMAVLGEHGAQQLCQFVVNKEASKISTAPGIGKKLAERLVLELSGKIEKWAWLNKTVHATNKPVIQEAESKEQALRSDLTSALQNLGYQPTHIKSMMDQAFARNSEFMESGFEGCLRHMLRELSGRALPA